MALKLRIGSRPSRLALVQAEIVRARLASVVPDLDCEIVEIRTTGDRMTTASLARVGGKGLFIRELEQALTEGRIDLAVHSLKDLPAILAPAFQLAAIPPREDPRDVLVTKNGASIESLSKGARLGTSSLRRRFQVLKANDGLEVLPLRGNVDTRLLRVTDGTFDAVVIAMAGLKRLGRAGDVKFMPLNERDFIPTGGQAALAIETLTDAPAELIRASAALDDSRSRFEVTAERAFLATIGASCVTPVGVKATVATPSVSLRAVLFSEDGTREISSEIETQSIHDFAPASAESLGRELGEQMLARGADQLITHE